MGLPRAELARGPLAPASSSMPVKLFCSDIACSCRREVTCAVLSALVDARATEPHDPGAVGRDEA